MSGLGCPKCGRTPVVYFVSSKKWVCRHCNHEWAKEKSGESAWEDSWGPQYVVNTEMVEKLRKQFSQKKKKPIKKVTPAKPAKKKSAPKSAKKQKGKKR
jgi:ribosomal protein L37AE/L43A